MTKDDDNNASIEDSLKEAQLEKIHLEIENLRKDKAWSKKFAVYIPLVTAALAVGGFLFGIFQFINEQQKERLAKEVEQGLKIDNQIRSNIEQILQFPSDKQQTISRTSFLLVDLQSLLDLKSQLELRPDIPQTSTAEDRKNTVSYSFISSITDDCNFD